MRLRHDKVYVRTLLLCFLLSAFAVDPRSSDRILLKLEKSQTIEIPESTLQDIAAIQELDSCWIVKASWDDYLTLQQSGIACEILDQFPSEKAYYLLLGTSADQIQAVEPFGHLTAIEERIWLFWSEGEEFWDILPAQVHVKRLAEQTAQRLTLAPEKSEEIRSQEEAPPDPQVIQMVSQVAKDNLSSCIQDLQNFQTRRATTANLEGAGAYIYDSFNNQGIPVAYDVFTFSYQGTTYATRNVVATIQGRTTPEQIVIVGAHYDSTSNQALTLAPGADDNASGSAAVMELARIMSRYPFDFTLRFICFSAEELGLLGSRHYSQEAAQRGETIRGMIDLDMIGYAANAGEDLDVITNSASEWLADLFVSCTGNYTTLPVVKSIRPSATGSDHSPFWDRGYSAVMGIEAYPLVNPYYHRTTDTLATLDMDFATAVARAALATAATLAQPVSTPLRPTNVLARSFNARSLFSRFKTVMISWQSADPTVVGFHLYRSTSPDRNFQKINAIPIQLNNYADRYLDPGKLYYYAVTAIDGQGRESGYSKEARDDQK